jgi:hypothetical protein
LAEIVKSSSFCDLWDGISILCFFELFLEAGVSFDFLQEDFELLFWNQAADTVSFPIFTCFRGFVTAACRILAVQAQDYEEEVVWSTWRISDKEPTDLKKGPAIPADAKWKFSGQAV